jgi:hypothetical protein
MGTPVAAAACDMAAYASNRVRDGIVGAASIGTIVAGMAAIDKTFCESLVGITRGELPIALTLSDLHLQHITQLLTNAVGLSGFNFLPLMSFLLAALVLFVLMFRV